jgi:hypothetical protein
MTAEERIAYARAVSDRAYDWLGEWTVIDELDTAIRKLDDAIDRHDQIVAQDEPGLASWHSARAATADQAA